MFQLTADDELKNLCKSFKLDESCHKEGDKTDRVSRLRLFTELRAGGVDKGEMSEILRSVSKVPCYTLGSKYTPENMWFQGKSDEVSAQDCQRRCTVTSDCGHFTYWANKGCHVQGPNAKLKHKAGAVLSGPRTCSKSLPTKDYVQNLQNLSDGCSGTDQCASGLEIARVLEKAMSQDELVTLCLLLGARCCRGKVYMGTCTWFDKEMLALRSINALGGGTVSLANKETPFGKCQTDSDCKLPHTACVGEEGFTKGGLLQKEKFARRQCVCTPGHCYDKLGNTSNCEPKTGDVDQVMDVALRSVVSQKIELGRLMTVLQAALNSSRNEDGLDGVA